MRLKRKRFLSKLGYRYIFSIVLIYKKYKLVKKVVNKTKNGKFKRCDVIAKTLSWFFLKISLDRVLKLKLWDEGSLPF